MLLDVHTDAKREVKSEIESIKSQIAAKRKQIEEVEDLMITDRTNAERYARILSRYENEVCELENKVDMLETLNRKDIKPKLHYAIMLINNLVMYVKDAPVEVKIKLIGSIFPEKVIFDGKQHRTKKLNSVLELIYNETNELRGQDKKKRRVKNSTPQFSTQSRGRTGTGVNLLVFETSASTDSAIWAYTNLATIT